MSADPKLSVSTKLQLGAFAAEMVAKYPKQASTILSLQDSLEGKLDKNPQLQNDIIRKLNGSTGATLAEARRVIEKDPKILDEVNKDPTKLATLMGIKVAAPAAAAPVTAPSAPAVEKADKPAAAQPASKPAAAPAKPEAAAVVASKPLSDQEIALRKQVADESLKVTQMKGFTEFAARAEKSQSLSQAVDAMMGRDAATPQDAVKKLKELQTDPEFFVKANAGIDEIPEQARETVFTQIAENPELGTRALAGDADAKSELMMKSTFGGLFGAGPDGKGGLSSLFGGEGMKGLGEMIQKIIPALMSMFQGMIGKFMDGLQSFTKSPDLMRMGNNPEGTRDFSLTAGKALGVEGGKQRIVDAIDPNAPAVPASQLGGPKPEIPVSGNLRRFEVQQSANEDQFKRQGNGPSGPSAG